MAKSGGQRFQVTAEEAEALRAAWEALQGPKSVSEQFGIPTDAPDRQAFTELRKALVTLGKALQPFEMPFDNWLTQRSMLHAQWQAVTFKKQEPTSQDELRQRVDAMIQWIPEMVDACEVMTRGAGASVSNTAMTWITASSQHWRRRLGKKPGLGASSRYVQAILTMQDHEPWPKVTERMLRTADKRGIFDEAPQDDAIQS